MRVVYRNIGRSVYCDVGRYEGMMRVEVDAYVYMSQEEFRSYTENGIAIRLGEEGSDDKDRSSTSPA